MTEKVSGSADKIDKIITIGGKEDEIRNLADALAAVYQISAAPNVLDAAKRLTKETFSAIVLDLADHESDMVNILQTLNQLSPDTPVIVIGNPHDTRLVVNAIKAGAFDFVTRPYPPEKIKLSVHQALENRSLKNEIDYLRREQDVVYDYNRIIAVSPPMQNVIKAIKRLSQTDSTILVTGETGTGKSFLSGNIHFNSPRRNKPFVGVNCANIPETLLESELFGHAKGAFTGADKTRTGRFEQAGGGTLFLDEFCELSLGLQAKILRAIEQKSFERLGSNKTIQADTRIIAATNRDIEALVRMGKFREDLYYRINVLRIHMPPLRERKEDIPLLVDYFLQNLSKQVDISSVALQMIMAYGWPGNIRELKNVIESASVIAENGFIEPAQLPAKITGVFNNSDNNRVSLPAANLPLDERLKEIEKSMIIEALRKTGGVQVRATELLGINQRSLWHRIKKYGIDVKGIKNNDI